MARIDSPAAASLPVLRKYGKTFYFAGRFLGKEALEASARLYAFCRHVDDEVDLAESTQAAVWALAHIREALISEASGSALIADFKALSAQYALSPAVTLALLDGMEADLGKVRIADEAALLRYCYQVAGTVGIHMSQILGTSDEDAVYHAVDLGIAMQLTNIARDVLEDAARDRLYLPRTLVGPVEPDQISTLRGEERQRVQGAVLAVLEMAETYYASGMAGIAYLPRRARLGITVAAQAYREIGSILKSRSGDYGAGRAYVGMRRKLHLAARCALSRASGRSLARASLSHERHLHAPLQGLPFCHGTSETDS